MIDCHCHLLPGIDDGARDLQRGMAMAAKAVENGISDSILTPHHLNGVFVNSRESILKAMTEFKAMLAGAGIALNIHPGSELHLVPELLTELASGSAMTYADQGKAVLVELPKHTVPIGADQILENIVYQGLTPVIAHPERNSYLRRHPDKVQEWIEMGCCLQLTAQSCSGDFGGSVQKVCRYFCDMGWVHFIASDAHRVEGRAPDMRAGAEAVEKWIGKDAVRLLSVDNPGRLIRGEDIVAVG